MLRNKLNLACLCVAFCFGCGSNHITDLNTAMAKVDVKKGKYNNSADVLETFHKNANFEFNFKMEHNKAINNMAFNYRNETQKDQFNRENSIKKIDYIQTYIDAASSEYANNIQQIKTSYPSNLYDYLTKDIYTDSNKTALKADVLKDTLAFTLTTKIVDLMIIFPKKFDSLKNALYDSYNKVFKQITGLEINFQEMCEKAGLPVYIVSETHKTFPILTGLPIVVIENYALLGKKVSSGEAVSLHKIFHDNCGSSKTLLSEKNAAYLLFLESIKNQLSCFRKNLQTHLSPLYVISTTYDMTNSKTATLGNLKALVDNEKSLPNFSNWFAMQGQKVVLKQGNDIIPQSDGTIAFAQNILNDTQLQTFSKLIKGFIGKDFMTDLNQIVKSVNSNVVKTRKKDFTKTGFDCPIKTIKIS